jgi:hypothetical protein
MRVQPARSSQTYPSGCADFAESRSPWNAPPSAMRRPFTISAFSTIRHLDSVGSYKRGEGGNRNLCHNAHLLVEVGVFRRLPLLATRSPRLGISNGIKRRTH